MNKKSISFILIGSIFFSMISCTMCQAEDEKTILHKAEESFSISHADIQAVKT
jgi:hypothetical protein